MKSLYSRNIVKRDETQTKRIPQTFCIKAKLVAELTQEYSKNPKQLQGLSTMELHYILQLQFIANSFHTTHTHYCNAL